MNSFLDFRTSDLGHDLRFRYLIYEQQTGRKVLSSHVHTCCKDCIESLPYIIKRIRFIDTIKDRMTAYFG